MDFSRLIDWFKVSNTHLLAVIFGCSILLFGSDNFLKKLGLFGIKDLYETFISIFFIISVSILGARFCNAIFQWVRKRIIWNKNLRRMQERLHNLTFEEKKILRVYIYGNTRTQVLLVQDGIVQGLVSENILYRSANLGTMMGGFAFNIQPWARDYLQANKKLLE